ncbi:MAG: hypothetical protein U0263_09330 [Polyangiaceae bacterium]
MKRAGWLAVVLSVLSACTPARHQAVSRLPRAAESQDYPAPEKLATVAIPKAEWAELERKVRTSPCDRHAKFVAKDRLSLLREALERMAAEGREKLDIDCTPDEVTITLRGRSHSMDFVRATVDRDAHGKMVRFDAFSSRTGLLARGTFHQKARETDGLVIVDLRRYLPTQVGKVHFGTSEDREELFIGSAAADDREGIYVVTRAWGEADDLELGIARYAVGDAP